MSLVMDKYDVLEEETNLRYFSAVFGGSQFFGALTVILMAVWMGSYDGGFGWSEIPDQQFHYHPLFMAIGLLFLQGEAILVYRVFRHEKKKFTKTLHVVLHSMTFVFLVVGLKAVFDSFANKTPGPAPNMQSAHSWIGLGTVLLFSCQYACGFVAFFCPGLSQPVRSWYMPIHRFFGLVIFVLAVAAALMGVAQTSHSHYNPHGDECDQGWCSKKWVVIFLSLSITLYALSVAYLVGNERFKRRSLPEEESLQQLTAD